MSKRWWISWRHYAEHYSPFEIHTPWWVSGSAHDFETICAAVIAPTEEAAKAKIIASYDEPPKNPDDLEIWDMPESGGVVKIDPSIGIVWRFCNMRADDWSPYGDRFQEPDWAKWPPEEESEPAPDPVKSSFREEFEKSLSAPIDFGIKELEDGIAILRKHGIEWEEKDES